MLSYSAAWPQELQAQCTHHAIKCADVITLIGPHTYQTPIQLTIQDSTAFSHTYQLKTPNNQAIGRDDFPISVYLEIQGLPLPTTGPQQTSLSTTTQRIYNLTTNVQHAITTE